MYLLSEQLSTDDQAWFFKFKMAFFSMLTQKISMQPYFYPLIWSWAFVTEKVRPKWVEKCLAVWHGCSAYKYINEFQRN